VQTPGDEIREADRPGRAVGGDRADDGAKADRLIDILYGGIGRRDRASQRRRNAAEQSNLDLLTHRNTPSCT
jgi:hypothetical protein